MSKLKNVVMLKIKGHLNVVGIYNYNGSSGGTSYAKQDANGIDYTSSGCLRQLMWREEIPRQPSRKELEEQIAKLAGSFAGYCRGLLEASTGAKKNSCVSVLDAYTITDKKQLVLETRTSSKPTETGLKSKSKHKEGEESSDTSFFAKQNAGERKQSLEVSISIQNLQSVVTDGEGSIVSSKHKAEFMDNMKESLKGAGVSDKIQEVEFKNAQAVFGTTQKGVIFNDEQQAALVSHVVSKVENLSGTKAGAKLEVDLQSLQVEIYIQGSLTPVKMKLDDFKKLLTDKKVEFAPLFKKI